VGMTIRVILGLALGQGEGEGLGSRGDPATRRKPAWPDQVTET
jgi:hypothetical protein